MLRGNKIVVFCIFIVLFSPFISNKANAEASYQIEGNSNLIIEFSEETGSVFIIEVDNSISEIPYSLDIKDQYDGLVAARTSYTKNLVVTFIGTGSFALTIDNPNTQTLEISISIESFTLTVNDEINGFSHKNKIFCWSFNSGSIIDYKVFPIETLKRGYYNLHFSSAFEDISAILWFSFYHPSYESNWNEYLESMYVIKNQKVLTDLEDQELYLVTDILSPGNHEITIVLRSTIPSNVVIIIVGVSAAVIGAIIFALYFLDPLKYRKREVKGEDYDIIKQNYEQPEDLGETITKLLTDANGKK